MVDMWNRLWKPFFYVSRINTIQYVKSHKPFIYNQNAFESPFYYLLTLCLFIETCSYWIYVWIWGESWKQNSKNTLEDIQYQFD